MRLHAITANEESIGNSKKGRKRIKKGGVGRGMEE